MIETIKKTITDSAPFPIKRISKLGEGVDCIGLSVNEAFVVKIPKSVKAREKLRNECEILKFFDEKRVSFSVPKLVACVQTGDENIPFYSVITKMRGKQLTRRTFDLLKGEQKENMACDIASFLNELHSLMPPKVTRCDMREKYMSERNRLFRYVDFFDEEAKKVFHSFYAAIFKFYSENPVKQGLIHGDFSVDMIFYDFSSKRIGGYIDFGNGQISDIENDFIYLLENQEDYPLNFGQRVLELYNQKSSLQKATIDCKIKLDHIYWDFEKLFKAEQEGDAKALAKQLKILSSRKKLSQLSSFQF